MISDIVNAFVAKVEKDKEYTLDELKKLLAEVYKTSTKKKSTGEKKPPSKYNIFIKEEIQRIKQANPDVDNKKLMSMAAANWKESQARKEDK